MNLPSIKQVVVSTALVILSVFGAGLLFTPQVAAQQAKPGLLHTATASALPPLTGEAAVTRLKEQGLYSSLTTAVQAARSASASAPESLSALNLPFTQLLKQTAPDGAADDDYGRSVAASNDLVVVGARLDKVGANARQGSAYVFVRTGSDWTFQQKLTASDGAAEDWFGSAVALSGDTIVVGAPYHKAGTNMPQGAAYVFTRSGGDWSLQQKLLAPDRAAGDEFGGAVALSGGTVVVGAQFDDIDAKADQGSASVFVRSNGVWSFQQKLTASDGEATDRFGAAVALSGGTVIVGAVSDDLGISGDAGSAYVFVRSGTVWAQQQKLSGLNSVGSRTNDQFGAAVALSGDTAIIGAPLYDTRGVVDQGLAVVFVRSGGVWSYQGDLAAYDGAANDRFGGAVALNGETALIGAPFDDIGAILDQGSAYLFTRSGALWTTRQKLTAQQVTARELFGQTVALSGDAALAGAPHARVGANVGQGALYLFGCGYFELQQFTSLGGEANDLFGAEIAVDGDTAVVGVPWDDVGANANQGSAYVFVRTGLKWTQAAQLFAFDGKAGDQFGASVAISGDTIVIGASGTTVNGKPNQGAAYFFVRLGGAWTLMGRHFGDTPGEYFGSSVAVSGNLIAVGAPEAVVGGNLSQGSVSLFNLSPAHPSGLLEGVVTANDGGAFDHFGRSVALSGDRLLVGMIGPNSGERSRGGAYIFERSATQSPLWEQRAKLLPDDSQINDHLGRTVALSGNTALVSTSKVIQTPVRRQAAYVFVAASAPGGAWSQQARLILGEGHLSANVFSFALSGNTAVVGSRTDHIEGRTNQGIVHVFTRTGTVWTPRQQIVASDIKAEDQFGAAVALTGDTVLIGSLYAGSRRQGTVYVLKQSCGTTMARLTSVSAASFTVAGGLAPESITALFGVNLADKTQAAASLPLPATLAGVSLKVTDSAGVERLAPLFFVSPGQINYVIPAGTANGPATLTVMNAGEPVASGESQIASAAPGLFSANSSGAGVAAALALRIKADGSQSYEPVAQFDPEQNRFVPTPIELSAATDQVFLVFYGTGLRYRSSLSAVSCVIGGVNSEALFAGPAPGFAGLDQVNVRLPRSLARRGEVDVELFVDGEAANKVRVSIR